jgi:hypothetical protein
MCPQHVHRVRHSPRLVARQVASIGPVASDSVSGERVGADRITAGGAGRGLGEKVPRSEAFDWATGVAYHRETEPDNGPVLVGERGGEPGRVDAVPAGDAAGHGGLVVHPAVGVGELRAGERRPGQGEGPVLKPKQAGEAGPGVRNDGRRPRCMAGDVHLGKACLQEQGGRVLHGLSGAVGALMRPARNFHLAGRVSLVGPPGDQTCQARTTRAAHIRARLQ